MKTIIAILVISSLSWAKGVEMLTHAEFVALSKEKQVEYLKGVQKIVSGMAERTPYMAEMVNKNSRMPANAGAAAEVDMDLPKSAPPAATGDATSEDASKSRPVISKTAASPAIATPAPPVASAAASSAASAASAAPSAAKPAAKVASKPAAQASAPTAAAPPASPQPTVGANGEIFAPPPPRKTAGDEAPPPRPAAVVEAPTSDAPAKVTLPEVKVTADKKKVEADVAAEKAASSGRGNYACMYGGFVIEKSPCRGYTKLPDTYKSLGLSDENSTCEEGEVVCNPVIFGLDLPKDCPDYKNPKCKEQAKVLCGPIAGYKPTWHCKQKSSSGRAKPVFVAARIIDENKELYDDYQVKFHDLCDDSQIEKNEFINSKKEPRRTSARKDVVDTCKWAENQMDVLNNAVKILSDSKAGKATPSGTTPAPAKKDEGAAKK